MRNAFITLMTMMVCLSMNAQMLITTNSNWSYLDDGSDQGTAWTANGFNDSGWATGNAELGYGDGGEATVVSYGPDANNKYITTYVRQEFNVADAGAVTSLDVNILVDDGAVVYLNGTELFRRNMPTGTIDYLTNANVIVSGGDESAYFSYTGLPSTALVTGTNVIAVEIHNRDGTSSDLGFNLSLEAITSGGGGGGSELIAAGATWTYKDDGSDQGTAWSANGFNDGSWASGDAQLGYGDGDETTTVGTGGTHATYYFRHEFNVADASAVPSLNIDLLVDDGAVVYLNGNELFRRNMAGGSVDYQTLANVTVGGTDENTYFSYTSLPSGSLVNGTNVLAVEVHQAALSSSDISLDLVMTEGGIPGQPVVTRGPYLQIATPTSILVKWRTDISSDAIINYGTSLGSLNQSEVVGSAATEHAITLSGLTPNTKYYYEIANGAGAYEGGTADYSFTTAPNAGVNQPTRAWILGDAGTANQDQRNVRDAYYNYVNSSGLHTDMILMLGDNAYSSGTDEQYQAAFFDIYDNMLRNTTVWSTLGNHDSYTSNAYFDIFNNPTGGEAGGEPSGTESYFSFDYGNIHIISLNSMSENRSVGATMYNWCEADLQNTNKDWIVVIFHHPPYTKGSHNSDTESELIQMRENFNPLFEAHGVDLILSGHSHSYERSYLLKGHYGNSGTFNLGTHALDAGSGNPSIDNSYAKTLTGPTAGDGAVYITAGSSGKVTGTLTHHPAMYEYLYQRGSVVMETQANEMRVRFLHESGTWNDEFIIQKAGMSNQAPVAADDNDATFQNTAVIVDVLANDSDPNGSLDASSVTITSAPAKGTITNINATTGAITYLPNPGESGNDVFEYTVCDDGIPTPVMCDAANVTINIQINTAPVAVDDADNTNESVSVDVDVIANDSDAEGNLDASSVTITQQPGNGTITNISPAGVVSYDPDNGFSGPDVFKYTVDDDLGLTSNEATVTVNVLGNVAPIAGDDSDNTTEATLVLVSVLANDNDPNGDLDPSSISTTGLQQAAYGTTNVIPGVGIEYTPNAGFIGIDEFEYQICDQSQPSPLCDVATVTITVGCDGITNGTDDQISGQVFTDNNGNGTAESGETGESGVTVWLYDDQDQNGSPDGAAIQTTTTNSSGNYTFDIPLAYSQAFSYDQRIASSSDDAYEDTGKGDVKETDLDVKVAKPGRLGGWRFQGVNIPSGATIDDATMYFDNGDKAKSSAVNIHAELALNTVTFSANNDLSSRPVTSTSVPYSFSWAQGQQDIQTPDLAPIIQEVVNGQGGVNDLVLLWYNNGSNESKVLAYDDDPARSARLVINYSIIGAGSYTFLTEIDLGDLPGGTNLTTAQYNSVTFTGPSQEDCGNDFGVSGCTPGNSCDDGDACTINDIYDAQCGCAGTLQDTDSDGTCDADDGCPNDPNKIAPGDCGCGVADTDTDSDGTADCLDACPTDPGKTDPGTCGCGVADADTDSDGTPDCNDGCPSDPNKTAAGVCGCGVADTDTDSDGTPDCNDLCPTDPGKTDPGSCGCGVADVDTDSDGTLDCNDGCPTDPAKIAPGDCGCGVADTDTDSDGTADCNDGCPLDANKTAPGDCGCGVADTDTDSDGTADCVDACPTDPNKIAPGDCGCGVADTDTDSDGTADCVDACPNDPGKTDPGTCGCGVADSDTDSDGTPDCNDGCPTDPNKTDPGTCGCGVSDGDSDGDGTIDCNDGCPFDPNKQAPGDCGCGVADTDTDSDGTPDCNDACPTDPGKTDPGSCGCGVADTDTDSDGTADCNDGCPTDPNKIAPGDCGCGVADTDTDSDGTADCVDACPTDPGKTDPGTCGCGVADTDTDSDGTPDCNDGCPSDPGKIDPGTCGCGTADVDTDSDGTLDCNDGCPNDPGKIAPGDCGCGVADTDTDSDGTADCNDGCPLDANKTAPGDCGCGVADTDSDSDGTADCNDGCPSDPNKIAPGDCGCGVADTDTDSDGTADCLDACPTDPGKTDPGTCGCGVADTDTDSDGTPDCNDGCPSDPNKIDPGTCGCGVSDVDSDGDSVPDCNDICPGGDDLVDLNGNQIPDDCEVPVDTTEVIFQIQDSDDDAQEESDGDVKAGDNENKLGKDRDVGLRFAGITIPDGATIVSAHFEFVASKSKTGNPSNVIIHGEDNVNPAPYTSSSKTYAITNRPIISTSVNWNSIQGWSQNNTYQSVDISPIVQDLIDAPGWTSGNAMAFMLYHNGSQERKAISYDKDPNRAPKLIIKYVGGNPQQRVDETSFTMTPQQDEELIDALPLQEIILYPNPAKDELNTSYISSSDGSVYIQVFDIMGKLRYEAKEGVMEGVNTFRIDVSHMPSGNYFMRIVNDDKQQTMQFMVE